jgi:hypothetical protein
MASQKNNPSWRSWWGMIRRCYYARATRFERWGGRGITVCERWKTFEGFLADMGEKPEGSSLERIDNDKGYSPENCKWATPKEQARNTRRNRLLTFNGITLPLVSWVERTGLKRTAITQRIDSYGWTIEQALTAPLEPRKRKEVYG